VLAFIVDCLGVPKEAAGYSYKDLERLKKGGMATDKYWEVARKVMDSIVCTFMGNAAAQKTDSVLKQKFAAPVRRTYWRRHKGLFIPVPEFGAPAEAIYWKRNAAGELEDFGEVLLHDWIEFLFRHEFLAGECGSTETPSIKAIAPWASMFVVPFLAQNLIEYIRNDSRLERGMPGGRFWYLPQLIPPEDGKIQNFRFKWPVNFVLEWWQDLLGYSLESVADKLCHPDDTERIADRFRELGGIDDEARQVRAWMNDNRTPKQKTIAHWCAQPWDYKGAFLDEPALPPHERWKRCRAFLVKKGFHNADHNWLESVDGKPREMFQKQYRGERLEEEILPFKQAPFAAFFDSPDPIAAGLPVIELIERVAERWAKPMNGQVKGRLLMAAAFQRAFVKSTESLGEQRSLHLLRCFQEVYCFLMDLNNRGIEEGDMVRLLRETPESKLRLRYLCEWLFDEESWRTLPNDIGAFLKS